MHKSFADWYQLAATVKPTGEMLTKRWLAVEAMAKWEKRGQLQDLVRLVRGTCPSDAPIRGTIADAVRASDNTFSTRDNEGELRVLAGATIVAVLDAPSERADLVGLALVASTFQKTQGDAIVHEFSAYAQQYLSSEAVRVRSPGSGEVVPDPVDLKEPLDVFRAAMPNSPDHKQTAEPIAALASAVATTLGTALRHHATQVSSELDALREESNMFWWVFSGFSRDLEQPFSTIGLPATCLIAAKELADLTRLFPGPRSASALLDRVLRDVATDTKRRKSGTGANTIQISDAVNEAPREWRAKWLAAYAPATARELTPLLTAVEKSLETDNAKDWISLFTKATTIPDASHLPGLIATQAYLESILADVVASNKA